MIITVNLSVRQNLVIVSQQIVVHELLLHLARNVRLHYLIEILSILKVDKYVKFSARVV